LEVEMKFFVVADREDPGSEHDTFEEAQGVVRDLRAKGFKDAIILTDEPQADSWCSWVGS
jgi:hypothetical protein